MRRKLQRFLMHLYNGLYSFQHVVNAPFRWVQHGVLLLERRICEHEFERIGDKVVECKHCETRYICEESREELFHPDGCIHA